MKKAFLIGIVVGAATAFGCASMAQNGPVVDIGSRHGNLRHAQEYIVQAWQALNSAQYENHSELGGHAARAKDLLMQADEELRQAANVANQHEH